MANKNFCTIHHLYYNGNECSLCRSERLKFYDSKYNVKANHIKKDKIPNNSDREITKDDIFKLKNKFDNKL